MRFQRLFTMNLYYSILYPTLYFIEYYTTFDCTALKKKLMHLAY